MGAYDSMSVVPREEDRSLTRLREPYELQIPTRDPEVVNW